MIELQFTSNTIWWISPSNKWLNAQNAMYEFLISILIQLIKIVDVGKAKKYILRIHCHNMVTSL